MVVKSVNTIEINITYYGWLVDRLPGQHATASSRYLSGAAVSFCPVRSRRQSKVLARLISHLLLVNRRLPMYKNAICYRCSPLYMT